MHKNICFVYSSYSEYSVGIPSLINQGYTVFFNYKNSLLRKIIRKIAKIYKLYWKGFSYLLWGKHYKYFAPFEIIIVFDIAIEEYFCDFISHNFSTKKLILYYVNTIRNDMPKEKEIAKYKHSEWDIFSFDELDCLAFNLKHNPYFFTAQYLTTVEPILNTIDKVFFIGKKKNRNEKIIMLKNRLDELGIKNEIIIIDTNTPKHSKTLVPYIKYPDAVKEANILLDIVNEGQAGATQRELEAVFFRKKLLTNNPHIKQRNYYNENNIFIIDYSKQDILEDIQSFLERPFMEIDKNTKEYYTIENWLKRFSNDSFS